MDIKYYELLIKRQQTFFDQIKKSVLFLLMIAFLVIGFYYNKFLILAAIFCVLFFLEDRRVNLEYEYIFTDGRLDIDRILKKSSRRRIFSIYVKDIKVMAPTDDLEVKQYSNLRMKNYSSRIYGRVTYEMVVGEDIRRRRVRIEPDEELMELIEGASTGNIFL